MKNTTMKIFRDPSGTDDSRSGALTLKEKCFYENARNKRSQPLGNLSFDKGIKKTQNTKVKKHFKEK